MSRPILILWILATALSACGGLPDCTPQADTYCHDSVVFWYDSCHLRGEIKEECDCACNLDHTDCRSCQCVPDCAGKTCGMDGCGDPCPPGCGPAERCNDLGSCECSPGTHACPQGCVSNDSPQHCGTSCATCPDVDHGLATCDGVQCGIACDPGYEPCQGACTPGGCSGIDPPLGGSSGGSGGSVAPGGVRVTAGGVSYIIIVPSGYTQAVAGRLMIVYSGTEGDSTMASNLRQVAGMAGLSDVIFAILDGVDYYDNGQAGATVLQDVRTRYNIDNDRTFLLSESAGTRAGLRLGLDLRQSYFAACWANDVNASSTPASTATQLGFVPWGNAGPGGAFAQADAIVAGMRTAGYRLPADAPYSGPGANTHGSTDQFLAAVGFFDGKSRD